MGIYISEINMPKGEGSKLVLQIFPNGEVYDEHGFRLGITKWAGAIPVPPHRLIDREQILDSIRIELAQANAVNDMEDYDSWIRVFDYVRKFPAIIPADPAKEGE